MKKFSTRVCGLAVALAGIGGSLPAITSTTIGLLTIGLSTPAAAQKATPPLEISPDAPDRYTVVKGDTLWDISGRFLEKPWRWPEIWHLNREQIKDPHWIYPGDIVYLDRNAEGGPRLRLGRAVDGNNRDGRGNDLGNLQPMTRSASLARTAIPTISASAIDAFLNRPLIVDEKALATNPRLVGTEEGRLYLGRGDLAYVRGITDSTVPEWHIYRPSKPLLDPDTRKPIAYEALYVGTARLEKLGDPSTLRIAGTSEEVGVGDRLMPAERGRMINYAPHAPEKDIQGRVVSVYRGVAQAGRNSVIALNVGEADGVEVGHVLSILQRGAIVPDREAPKGGEMIKLPDESIGYLLVFRVFEHIAYGLILDASKAVAIGDNVSTP